MHDSIIQEIVDWQMWQRIAGKEPKQIKLAPHHVRALKAWFESTALYSCSVTNKPSRIYGMEIIEA